YYSASNAPLTIVDYTLSLHDALPIFGRIIFNNSTAAVSRGSNSPFKSLAEAKAYKATFSFPGTGCSRADSISFLAHFSDFFRSSTPFIWSTGEVKDRKSVV